tara:strand:- start:550 stop:813 length:264 start_codon:yes stop_codon:yes gene_type:complete
MQILILVSLVTIAFFVSVTRTSNKYKNLKLNKKSSKSGLKHLKALLKKQEEKRGKRVYQPTTKELIKYLNEIIKDDSVTILINKPKT